MSMFKHMGPYLWLILMVGGCNGSNRNPELMSFNGVEPNQILGVSFFAEPFYFAPGDRIPLTVDASDPDRDPLQIWFAFQPRGLCFDPDGTEGVWEVPDDLEEESIYFSLVIADDADPMGLTSVEIFYINLESKAWQGGGFDFDTGW